MSDYNEIPENLKEELDARYCKAEVAISSILATSENQIPRLLKSIGKNEEEINLTMIELEDTILNLLEDYFAGLQKEASEYGEEGSYYEPESERKRKHNAEKRKVNLLGNVAERLDYHGFLSKKSNPPLSFETWKLEKEIAEENKRASEAVV